MRASPTLARQVRAAGIRKVTGGVFADESFFDARRTGAGWKSWFYVNECPPLSALTVDRGRYLGRTSRDPALAAALLFGDALRRAGVAVTGAGHGTQRDDDVPLASVESAPLSQIVAWMDRDSDNFTAELLLKQLGAAGGEAGTSAGGAEIVRGALADAGVPLGGVRLMDGSGLSSLDRLTRGRSRACCGPPGPIPTCARTCSRRCRSPAGAGRSPTACARRPRAATSRRRPARLSLASALSGYVQAPLRLLGTAERQPGLVLLGAPRAGPLRDRR